MEDTVYLRHTVQQRRYLRDTRDTVHQDHGVQENISWMTVGQVRTEVGFA